MLISPHLVGFVTLHPLFECLALGMINYIFMGKCRSSAVLVQHFLNAVVLYVLTDNDLNKGWKNRMVTHKLELLIASGVILMVFLALSIGLGGEDCSFCYLCAYDNDSQPQNTDI